MFPRTPTPPPGKIFGGPTSLPVPPLSSGDGVWVLGYAPRNLPCASAISVAHNTTTAARPTPRPTFNANFPMEAPSLAMELFDRGPLFFRGTNLPGPNNYPRHPL